MKNIAIQHCLACTFSIFVVMVITHIFFYFNPDEAALPSFFFSITFYFIYLLSIPLLAFALTWKTPTPSSIWEIILIVLATLFGFCLGDFLYLGLFYNIWTPQYESDQAFVNLAIGKYAILLGFYLLLLQLRKIFKEISNNNFIDHEEE